MRSLLLGVVGVLILAGCKTEPGQGREGDGKPLPSATSASLTEVPELSRYALGQPIEHGRLSFIPVVSRESVKNQEEYATLVEAKANGWVEIVELPGNEQVERLRVRNKGPKPLLLLGGELLLGGKQDRVVAHDTIVPAGKEIDVQVWCVEPGRWHGESGKFEAPAMMVPERVRKAAAKQGQQEVWGGVADYNAESGVELQGRSTLDASLSNPQIQSDMKAALSDVKRQLASAKNVVGVVVAVDGVPQNLELFGSARLFDAARDPLLTSFLAESLMMKGKADRKVDVSEAARFVSDSLNSRRIMRGKSGAGERLELAGANIDGAEVASPAFEGKMKESSNGFIHGSYRKSEGK